MLLAGKVEVLLLKSVQFVSATVFLFSDLYFFSFLRFSLPGDARLFRSSKMSCPGLLASSPQFESI